MNKIYKVLWNRARSTHVVTDEAKTAHGKGRSGVLSSVDLTTPLPILSLAASLFLGLSGSAWGTDITAASGWNHTTISNLANRWEISTDKVINKTGINRFDKFNLSQGHIANLQMGEASRVVPVDKLSVAITILLSFFILHEAVTFKVAAGGLLITAGALLMIF